MNPVLRAQRYIPQAEPIASTMKALQLSRARPSEDKKSFVRWAFPGLFLQEKGVWARRCRACLATRYQQMGMLCAQIRTSFCTRRYLERSWRSADHGFAVWRYIENCRSYEAVRFGQLDTRFSAGLVLCIGKPFHPSGNAWAVMIIWLLASAGGWLVERVRQHFDLMARRTESIATCRSQSTCMTTFTPFMPAVIYAKRHITSPVTQVGLPGPLGMILTGIAVGNINNGHLVKGLPASWSKELRAIALAIIFLRSGLELDLRVGPSLAAQSVLSDSLYVVSSCFICLTFHSVQRSHHAVCAGCS